MLSRSNFPRRGDEDPGLLAAGRCRVAAFQSADLILMNGATYSKWAEKVTLPQSKLVDTSCCLQSAVHRDQSRHHAQPRPRRRAQPQRHRLHDLDRLQTGIQQAEAVSKALIKLARRREAEKNFDALKDELEALDDRIACRGQTPSRQCSRSSPRILCIITSPVVMRMNVEGPCSGSPRPCLMTRPWPSSKASSPRIVPAG
jgi:zinc transport system substrate-binding protein